MLMPRATIYSARIDAQSQIRSCHTMVAAKVTNPVLPMGSQGLKTTRLGLGCLPIAGGYYGDGLGHDESVALIRKAYELGVRHFNTSDLYAFGGNEKMLGEALQGLKDVTVSTKWGPMIIPGKGFVWDLTPENARKCCLGSMERLRVPAIDLFILRGPVGPDVDWENTMRGVKALVDEGLVKYVGLSEVSADHIRRAHAIVPITAIEQEWSLFTRDIEKDLLPTCRELGIAIMAYCPLGQGILTGAIKDRQQLADNDYRKNVQPRFAGLDKNLLLVRELESLAQAKGCTAAQLALAWVMAQGQDVFPIPGTKREKYLIENMGSLNIHLTPEEIKQLEAAVPEHKVTGTRYPNMANTYHANVQAC